MKSANAILKISLGIAAIILSAAVFNLTIQKASAAPKAFIDEGTGKIGKYTVTMAVAASGDQNVWAITVMDTETGKARTYYDRESNSFGPSFNVSSSAPAGN